MVYRESTRADRGKRMEARRVDRECVMGTSAAIALSCIDTSELTPLFSAPRRRTPPGIVAEGHQEFSPLTGSPQSPGRGGSAGW